jgi:hypothetical protein
MTQKNVMRRLAHEKRMRLFLRERMRIFGKKKRLEPKREMKYFH